MARRQLLLIGFLVFAVLAVPPILLPRPGLIRVGSLFFLSLITLAGLHVVTGLARVVSLFHVALVGVGAYAAGFVALRVGAPALSVAAGAAAAALCALVIALVTRGLDDHYLALATLAASEILSNVFLNATSITGGANGLPGIPPLAFAGIALDTPARYYPACAAIGLAALGAVAYIDRSALGRALRAVGDEGERVASLGANMVALRTTAFVIGAAIAGAAGGLQAHIDGFVGPESFGVSSSIAYLCFLVVGGLGRLRSVVMGAFFASVGTELLRGLLEWQMVVVAVAALVVLLRSSARSGKEHT